MSLQWREYITIYNYIKRKYDNMKLQNIFAVFSEENSERRSLAYKKYLQPERRTAGIFLLKVKGESYRSLLFDQPVSRRIREYDRRLEALRFLEIHHRV